MEQHVQVMFDGSVVQKVPVEAYKLYSLLTDSVATRP